jgi:DNA (cytosine-5)-methyltransferase 1
VGPGAQQSGNPPEVHLRKKPGRTQVTDLAIIVENGLLETGGTMLPTPTSRDHKGHNQRRD